MPCESSGPSRRAAAARRALFPLALHAGTTGALQNESAPAPRERGQSARDAALVPAQRAGPALRRQVARGGPAPSRWRAWPSSLGDAASAAVQRVAPELSQRQAGEPEAVAVGPHVSLALSLSAWPAPMRPGAPTAGRLGLAATGQPLEQASVAAMLEQNDVAGIRREVPVGRARAHYLPRRQAVVPSMVPVAWPQAQLTAIVWATPRRAGTPYAVAVTDRANPSVRWPGLAPSPNDLERPSKLATVSVDEQAPVSLRPWQRSAGPAERRPDAKLQAALGQPAE